MKLVVGAYDSVLHPVSTVIVFGVAVPLVIAIGWCVRPWTAWQAPSYATGLSRPHHRATHAHAHPALRAARRELILSGKIEPTGFSSL